MAHSHVSKIIYCYIKAVSLSFYFRKSETPPVRFCLNIIHILPAAQALLIIRLQFFQRKL